MLTRFVDWLYGIFAKEDPVPEKPVWQTGVRVRPRSKNTTRAATGNADFSANIGGRIVDGGPGKNVLIRNKYVREDTGTHETLKIIDDSLLDRDEEFGADPYNTGRFDRSRSWDTNRSRK